MAVYEHINARLGLFSPMFICAGIGLYFSLNYEPSLKFSILCFCICLFLLVITRKLYSAKIITAALCFAAFGFAAAKISEVESNTKVIGFRLSDTVVNGEISDIEFTGNRTRIVLDNPRIDGLKPDKHPRRIRLSIRNHSNDITVGDSIRVRATIFPPPAAARVGGYNPSLGMYFKSIGATGYNLDDIEIITHQQTANLTTYIQNIRHDLTKTIMRQSSYPENTIIAALITGEQRMVPDDINNAYRAAGIMHILSISGFHIGLIAGLVFWLSRSIMALFPYLALHHPIKKYASVISLICTVLYLLISGLQVPAVRSFIMVAVMMLAIIADRKAISMRNVVIAAIIILCYSPESLLTPGFQLSFAATISLVAFYESIAPHIASFFHQRSIIMKPVYYLLMINLTSMIAGTVTAPFVIYHFNQVNAYGILGNLFAIPLSSFVIIPFAILALLPTGLSELFFSITERAIFIMNILAEKVAELSGSQINVIAPTSYGIIAIAAGLYFLCIWPTRARYFGLIIAGIGAITAWFNPQPDFIANEDSALLNLHNGSVVWLKGGEEGYAYERWMASLGATKSYIPLEKQNIMNCAYDVCTITAQNKKILLIDSNGETKNCEGFDVIINYSRNKNCAEYNTIGYIDFLRNGTYEFYLNPNIRDKTEILRARDSSKSRPW